MKLFFILALVALTACDSDNDNALLPNPEPAACTPPVFDPDFIPWMGNRNGNFVADATDDFVRFNLAREMVFNDLVYPTIVIDTQSRLFLDGINIGSVFNVIALDTCQITGLITRNSLGTQVYINILLINDEGTIRLETSIKIPIFAAMPIPTAGDKGENARTGENTPIEILGIIE